MHTRTKKIKRKQGEAVGVLGYGEVGKAIARFYSQPYVKDLELNQFPEKLEILHVCIPSGRQFIRTVSAHILKYRPRLVIIHSTIPVGTTKVLYEKFKNVVHSPVRGTHPKLFDGIKSFVKYVGADNKKLGEQAAKRLRSVGIKKIQMVVPSAITELGKLLDTTYYGLCIAYHAYAYKLCKTLGLNFEQVMTDFNRSYNDGYKKLEKNKVIRPILFPPLNSKIGGHCIIPNTETLMQLFGSDEILQAILRHK